MRRIPRRGGLAALMLLASAAPAVAADAWPVAGHDAAQTRRSSVTATRQPLLRPGWPVAGTAGPVRVAPDGAVTLQARGFVREAFIGRDGRYRRLGRAPWTPIAIGPDGRRYAFAGASSGRIRAWNAAGAPLWVSATVHLGSEASDRGILPGPGGRVYETGDYGVAAFDATGAILWQQGFGFLNTGALAVDADGVAYYGFEVGGSAHQLIARRPDGTQAWNHALPGRARSVALTDGAVIVSQDLSSALGGGAIVALSRSDGSELWRHATGLTAPGAPAVATDGGVFAIVGRTVIALGSDGALGWRRVGFFAGAPIIGGDGTVYAGGAPLMALRPADGAVLWRLAARARMLPQAIGSDGTLYAALESPGLTWALVPPGGHGTVIPGVPRRPLISDLRLGARVMRVRGAPSLCPTGAASCRPRVPLGARISFRLARAALVTLSVRRAGSSRTLARSDMRAPAGISWWATDSLLPRLAPGSYLLSARVAVGTTRMTTSPIPFRISG